MSQFLEIIMGTWIGINILALFILFILSVDGANFSFVNPMVIYKNIKVNWFGAWALTILANVLLPLVAIPYWIYKLCTVGRQ